MIQSQLTRSLSFMALLVGFFIVGCQSQPTKIKVTDSGLEERMLSRADYQKKFALKTAVIIDVRSRFAFDMSRLPRSFHVQAEDWDLSSYQGGDLSDQVIRLQRFLALKGVDPLTQVVILGSGLKGKGEEFLLASTLITLGVKKISFMNEENARNAVIPQQAPPLENISYWSRPAGFVFNCSPVRSGPEKWQQSDIVISKIPKREEPSFRLFKDKVRPPAQFFRRDLGIVSQAFPKSLRLQLYSPNSYWAYGLALFFKEQGGSPCVL